MARPFVVREPIERAHTRNAMLAVDVLDAVSLGRLTQGVKVKAEGLVGEPKINHSGLFVWLQESLAKFQKLVIEPGTLPYARVEIAAAAVVHPLHIAQLNPLPNYAFAPGTTAIRGALIETTPPAGIEPTPVVAATVRLEWLDDDGVTWLPASQRFVTDRRGQFAAFLRFTSADLPQFDANGNLKIRLFASRGAAPEKHMEFSHPQGRVADATYAWDLLLP